MIEGPQIYSYFLQLLCSPVQNLQESVSISVTVFWFDEDWKHLVALNCMGPPLYPPKWGQGSWSFFSVLWKSHTGDSSLICPLEGTDWSQPPLPAVRWFQACCLYRFCSPDLQLFPWPKSTNVHWAKYHGCKRCQDARGGVSGFAP